MDADVGGEEDGDEAKRMGETYASMALALYVRDPLVKMFLGSTPWDPGLTTCRMRSNGKSSNARV